MNCAWCGADDDGSNSHGICDECRATMELQSAQRQFDKVPSYVEVQAALFVQECDEILADSELCV
jgi:hypothetical protein